MAIYRIKNITDLLDKRHLNYKTIVNISYNEELIKKTIKLNVGTTKYMEFQQKPLSLQKLIMKGFVSVEEVSKKEVVNVASVKKQPIINKVKEVINTTTITKKPKKTQSK